MSEWIQRGALEETVCPPGHLVVVERRQIIHALVKRYRQATGRVVVAKQHVGDRRPGGLTRIPRLENRRYVCLRPVHRERAAVEQYKNRRLSKLGDALEQLFLRRRQIDRRPI